MDNLKKACALIILAECTKKKERNWDVGTMGLHLKCINVDKRLHSTVPDAYLSIMHMPRETYLVLLDMVTPLIRRKQRNIRPIISAHEILSITLQYLATGSSRRRLSVDFRIGKTAIRCMLLQTCEAIVNRLRDCIQLPTTSVGWREIARQFSVKWNFFNCLGAIVGKHIRIRTPCDDDGEKYLNYANFYSIILTAAVGANYEFLHVDTNMCASDRNATLGGHLWQKMYITNEIQLPEPEAVPATDVKLPYAFVTEDVPLTENILKPYTNANLSVEQEHFNEQIRRPLHVSENAVRLLVARFGVLRKKILMKPKKASTVVLACCYLHNFLLKNNNADYVADVAVEPIEIILPERVQAERPFLTPSQKSIYELVYREANTIRDKYMMYYNNIGATETPS